MLRLVVDAASPDVKLLEQAAAAIIEGGVVGMPTDTLYGLAADPFNEAAVARIFTAKGRAVELALPLVAADVDQVAESIGALPPIAAALAGRFWPGPLTLLLPAPARMAAAVSGGTGRVGVRVPAHAVTTGLCRASARPLTATSANLSGQPPSSDPGEVAAALDGRIDLLLDAGRTPGGPPSTIVDVTGALPTLVRSGAVPWERILECLDR